MATVFVATVTACIEVTGTTAVIAAGNLPKRKPAEREPAGVIGLWHSPCSLVEAGDFSVPVQEENAAGRVFSRPAASFPGTGL